MIVDGEVRRIHWDSNHCDLNRIVEELRDVTYWEYYGPESACYSWISKLTKTYITVFTETRVKSSVTVAGLHRDREDL